MKLSNMKKIIEVGYSYGSRRIVVVITTIPAVEKDEQVLFIQRAATGFIIHSRLENNNIVNIHKYQYTAIHQ